MRKNILAAFLFFNIAVTWGHATDSKEGVTISQHGVTHALLEENATISLERKPFEIRFMTRPYTDKEKNALRITASTNKEIFGKIDIGNKIDEVVYLAPGTGMAADENGYSSIFIDSEAHHYLYYSSENDRRAKLIFRQNDFLLLEWQVSSFFINNKVSHFKDSGLKEFFMVIVNDNNSNNIVEPGELNKVTIVFK